MSKFRLKGFTLVEAMISVGILGIVAAGVSSVTIMTSRISHANVYENTAFNIVQAYAEQIKSIDFAVIQQALENPGENDIPTQSLKLGTGEDISELQIDDPITFGVEHEKDIIIDIEEVEEGVFKERTMKLWVKATGTDLSRSTNCWEAIEVTLDFAWNSPRAGSTTKDTGQIKLLKTSISEF